MFLITLWTILGCICLVPKGNKVGKFDYFLCWVALMAFLIKEII